MAHTCTYYSLIEGVCGIANLLQLGANERLLLASVGLQCLVDRQREEVFEQVLVGEGGGTVLSW